MSTANKQDQNEYIIALKKSSIKIKELLDENAKLKQRSPIAIIGMACRFPGGAVNPELFWNNLKQGVDSVIEIPKERWSTAFYHDADPEAAGKTYNKYSGLISDFDLFDNKFFGISAVEAKEMDPQQRLLLEVSYELIENAGLHIDEIKGSKTGTYIGIHTNDHLKTEVASGLISKISPYSVLGNAFSVSCGRISYFYDFHGPSVPVDTACSSSITAIHNAVTALNNKEIDIALAGGVNFLLSPDGYIGLSKLHNLSKGSHCKAFDADADGFVRGEGCGMIMLKRLDDALANNDNVIGIIKGISVGQDGRSNGIIAPNGLAQEQIIKTAIQSAGISPNDVDWIETHGAGTQLGDVIEVGALTTVFKDRKNPLYISSVKTNIGHLESAAGIAGVIKVLLSLNKKVIPASLHFAAPNPLIPWGEISVEVAKNNIQLSNEKKRIAGVSSFGYNGSISHTIIEEGQCAVHNDKASLPNTVFTLSAKNEFSLTETTKRYVDYLTETTDAFQDICYTSNLSRTAFGNKLSVTAKSNDDLKKKLLACIENPERAALVTATENQLNKKLVFMFTGQGSQYFEMAAELYHTHPVFKDELDRCAQLASKYVEKSITDILYDQENKDYINQAMYAQPIIFSVEYSLAKLLMSFGLKPSLVLGHSIGEYTAACIAGIFSLADAIKIVCVRGKLMQQIEKKGKMAGILTNEETARELMRGIEDISIASINAPNNVTVSGAEDAVEEYLKRVKSSKIFIENLDISHAFHSEMMKPYGDIFYNEIKGVIFNKPQIPILEDLTGQLATDKISSATYWSEHLYSTLQFNKVIHKAEELGYNYFVEIGGTATLTGLAAQCVTNNSAQFFPTLRKERSAWQQLNESLSKLYLAGVRVDWRKYHGAFNHKKVVLPNYVFNRKRFASGPYPDTVYALDTTKQVEVQRLDINQLQHQYLEPVKNDHRSALLLSKPSVENVVFDVKEIISQVSGLDHEEVESDLNLFSLGLDSLMLVQFMRKTELKYGIEISMNEFLTELNTVEKIANFIHANLPNEFLSNHGGPSSVDTTASNGLPYPQVMNEIGDKNDLNGIFKRHIQILEQEASLLKSLSLESLSRAKQSAKQTKQANNKDSKILSLKHDKLNLKQMEFIKSFISRYNKRTRKSKEFAQQYRAVLADWINTLVFRMTLKEIAYPITPDTLNGARFIDLDGNEYLDICMGRGANFLGHNPPFVVKAIEEQLKKGIGLSTQQHMAGKTAELIRELTGCERVVFSNTGSEAIMAALRIVRTIRRRDKVVRFAGAFHGTFDGVMADGNETDVYPSAVGTTWNMVQDMVVLNYGAQSSLQYIRDHKDELAAVLVEPVQSRNPGFQPKEFLQQLREVTLETEVTLIFDETLNGFRSNVGGAQAHFGVQADLCTYGKIVGGGMPIGVIAGKAKFIDAIDGGTWNFGDSSYPQSDITTYGGTFIKHPLTMAASHAALTYLKEKGNALQEEVNRKTEYLAKAATEYFESDNVPLKVNHFGSQFRFQFLGESALESELFNSLMIYRGVYMWERRINSLSIEHTYEDMDIVLKGIKESVNELREGGFTFSKNKAHVNNDTVCYPVASHQSRIFTLCQFNGAERAYHITKAFAIEGNLDLEKLIQAINQLVTKHESLRTGFNLIEGQIFQVIHKQLNISVEQFNTTHTKPEDVVNSFIKPFELDNPPLIRFGLARLSPNKNILIIDVHHIIADGFSLSILASELMSLYNGEVETIAGSDYVSFVDWENEYRTSDKYVNQKEYWTNKLQDELPVCDLPADYSRPKDQNHSGQTLYFEIDKVRAKRIKNVSRKYALTDYMLMLSAFKIVIHKLSGLKDVVIGTPVAIRPTSSVDNAIGMLTNNIVLRSYPSPEKLVLAYLNEVKADCLQSYANMEFPFDDMINNLHIQREGNRNPVYSVMFVYEKADSRVFQMNGLQATEVNNPNVSSIVDLTLEVLEAEGKFSASINFMDKLFSPQTIERWITYYIRVIDQLLALGENSGFDSSLLSDVDLIDTEEENLILNEFNSTTTYYPRNKSIVELFEEQVAKTPERLAVSFDGSTLTYQELNVQSNKVAHYLREHYQIIPNDLIGFVTDRSERMMVAILGILKSGAGYIPIDPAYPAARIKFMLTDCKAKVLLIDTIQYQVDASINSIQLDELFTISRDFSTGNPDRINQSLDLAYVMYTSGSTGIPKGVMVEHRSVVRLVKNTNYVSFNEEDRLLQTGSIAFDASTFEIWGMLLNGGALYLSDQNTLLDTASLNVYVKHNEINKLWLTTSWFNELSDDCPVVFSTLKYLIIGGDKLSVRHVNKIRKLYPELTMVNGYGPTENATFSTCYSIDRLQATTVPIGAPISNSTAYILDDALKVVPIGVPGELYVGGDGLSRGYLNNEELTKEKFISNPFQVGERLYKTGDLCRWRADGTIEFISRKDLQIKIRGYRIEVGEIEHAIEKLENIEKVLVVVESKNEEKHLIAYYTSRGNESALTLKNKLKECLPSYMVPSYFVRLEAFPLTVNGKIDKGALPTPDLDAVPIGFIAPTSEIEIKVASIWQEVLGRNHFGIHDNYFDIGGHSLNAIRVKSLISKELSREINLGELFTSPTIASLASLLSTKEQKDFSSIKPIENKNYYDVSYSQRRLWVLSQFKNASATYNIPAAFKFSGDLNIAALEKAFNLLIARHEILRTSFTIIDGIPKQVIHTSVEFKLEVEEVTTQPLDSRLVEHAALEFNLQQSPLFNVKIFKLSEAEHVLLLTMHHIVGDGWSMNVFAKELMTYYHHSVDEGEIVNLPALDIHYKDFVYWQNSSLAEDTISSRYWSSILADDISPLELPFGKNRPALKTYAGSTLHFRFNEDTVTRLKTLGKSEDATLFMTLLACVKTLLYHYTCQEDSVVGTPVAGRNHADLENQIGFYVNTIVLRDHIDGQASFKNLLRAIKQNAESAFEHQFYPFDKLVDELSLSRDTSRNPLFDVVVALQNNEQPELSMKNLSIEQLVVPVNTSKFDLTFSFLEKNNSLELELEFNSDIYDQPCIERLVMHLQELIDDMVSNPDKSIDNLTILSAQEYKKVVHDFNDVSTSYPKDKSIVEVFTEQVKKTPKGTAIVSANKTFSYEQLDKRSNQLANYLLANGDVKNEDVVGLLCERGEQMIICILGILKAGAAYLPIDGALPNERIITLIKSASVKVLVTDQVGDSFLHLGCDTISLADDGSKIEFSSRKKPKVITGPNSLAYIMFTSGSTGTPKGIMIEHRNVVRLVKNTNFTDLGTTDHVLQLANYAFDGSVYDIFGSLLNGATLYIVDKEVALSVEKLADFINENIINITFITPALFNALIDMRPAIFASFDKVYIGGDVVSLKHVRVALGHSKKSGSIVNAYGPTESTTFASYCILDHENTQSRAPIGSPLANTSLYILNKAYQPVPIGIQGEIYIGGDGLARGYLNDVELTKKKFIPSPFKEGERLYKTGDLGKWLANGSIDFLGRIDHQVKIRGFRIEPGEIEIQLSKHAAIKESLIVAQDTSNSQKDLVAYLVLHEGVVKPDVTELRAFLSASLPSYMVPSFFIFLDRFILNVNGKIERKLLPQPTSAAMRSDYVAPESGIEHALAKAIQKVLRIERVGTTDNFFEIGGDSIKALQVSSELFQGGISLALRDIFSSPTIKGMTIHAAYEAITISQDMVVGQTTLTPIQKWFFANHTKGIHHFNHSMVLFKSAGFDEHIIALILQELVMHHDALRMVYAKQPDGNYNQYNRGGNGQLFDFEKHEIQNISFEGEVMSRVNAIHTSINLAEGPLIKCALFKSPSGDHLVFIIHHLVIDGVSWRILLEDFNTLYEQITGGKKPRLSKKTNSFKEWSERISTYANGNRIAKQAKYWQRVTSKVMDSLKEKDSSMSNLMGSRKTIVAALSQSDTKALLSETHKAYNTDVNDILLTALALSVQAWKGVNEVLLDLEGHGRENIISDINISRTIGWFTSVYPVVLSLPDDHSLSAQLVNIKETLRQIPDKGIGYGIWRYLSNAYKQKNAFQPEIAFNYLGQIENDFGKSSSITVSSIDLGNGISPEMESIHPLSINCFVKDNMFQCSIAYHAHEFCHESIDRLVHLYMGKLKEVINHCTAKTGIEFTPSDYGDNDLSIRDLKRIKSIYPDIDKIYSLAPMQEGMLFHSLMDPNSSSYFEQTWYKLNGIIDTEILERSYNTIVARYDILRTAFVHGGLAKPKQVVLSERPVQVAMVDITGLTDLEAEQRIASFLKNERDHKFNLETDPLTRVSVIKISNDSFLLVWSFHHIIMDGWCLTTILKELIDTYHAIQSNRPINLPAVEPYHNFIAWLSTRDQENGIAFWNKYLAGYDKVTTLPLKQNNSEGLYQSRHVSFKLNKEQSDGLKDIAQRNQVTINTVFQVLWGLLLQRYNNTDDVVFGAITSGRPTDLKGAQDMVGLFINTIPVRIKTEPDQQFDELIKQVQTQAAEAKSFEYLSLSQIQSQSSLRNDLINHVIGFENYPFEDKLFSEMKAQTGFEIVDCEVNNQTNYDFNILIYPGESFDIKINFNALAYEENTINRILSHISHIVDYVIQVPTAKVIAIEIVPDYEKNQLLNVFNDMQATYPDYPVEDTVVEMFEQQVLKTPDNTALVFGNVSLTYKQLNERANQMASYLVAENAIRPEEIVGIMMDRSEWLIISILAVLKSGAAYVPIDPSYPLERVKYILENSCAKLVIVKDKKLNMETQARLIDVDRINNRHTSDLKLKISANDLAYVIYTSGSTGNPKGVMIEHRGIVNLYHSQKCAFALTGKDVVMQFASVSFDASVWEIMMALLSGATLVVPTNETIHDVAKFKSLMVSRRVSVITLPPTYLQQLNKAAFPSLRILITAGDSPDVNDVNHYTKTCQYINAYGPTEYTVCASYHVFSSNDLRLKNIGKPISRTSLYVLDHHTQLMPIGSAGELCIAGQSIARGYLNSQTLTQEKFIANPFKDDDRLYRTGDMARVLPDGNIEFLGRMDEQVKIRGHRIDPEEIVQIVATYEGVHECVVIAGEFDNGKKELIAYIVLSNNATMPGTVELRDHLSKFLPSYMIPSYFVFLDKLPLTPNGKIDRRALQKPESIFSQQNYVAPVNESEQHMTLVWQDVLGIERVGTTDNFFDLGGNSVTAIQIVSRCRSIHAMLNVKDIFQYPTIQQLSAKYNTEGIALMDAKVVDSINSVLSDSENVQLVRVGYGDRVEASLDIIKTQQLEYSDLMVSQKKSNSYWLSGIQKLHLLMGNVNTIISIPFHNSIDKAILNQAFLTLVQRQGLLRCKLKKGSKALFWQEYNAVSSMSLSYIDLSDLASDQQEGIIREINSDLLKTNFAERDSLMYYIYLVKYNSTYYSIEVVCSHLIMDAMSVHIFKNSIEQYCKDLSKGLAVSKQAVKSYGNFIDLINQNASGIPASELRDKYRIAEFCQEMERASDNIKKNYFPYETQLISSDRDSLKAFTVSHSIDSSALDERNHWNLSFCLYCNLLASLFNTSRLPIFLISFGRKYGRSNYYNTIGEFIDLIPVLIDKDRHDASGVIQSANDVIDFTQASSINFLNAVLSDDTRDLEWREISVAVKSLLKRKMYSFNVFNFLGRFSETDFNAYSNHADMVLTSSVSEASYIDCSVRYTDNRMLFTIKSAFPIPTEIMQRVFGEETICDLSSHLSNAKHFQGV